MPETIPDENWFLYRPRTRSAKKRLSILEAIVISSDSEESEVDCARKHHVMKIVPKTEIVSDDSALEIVPRVIVTEDHFLKQEPIEADGSDKVHQPTASPEKVLSPVNTIAVEEMQPDLHCSNKNDSTLPSNGNILPSDLRDNDSYIQPVTDNNMDVDSTESIVDDVKQNVIETAPKKNMISDGSLLEEAAASLEIVTSKQAISTDSDAQANQHSPVEVLRVVTSLFADSQSGERVTEEISQNNVLTTDESFSQDKSYDNDSTNATFDDDPKQDVIVATGNRLISDISPFEGTAGSDVNSSVNKEIFEQQETVTGDCCVETHGPSISPVEVSTTSLLVEMENNFHLSCSRDNDSCSNVTDNSSQAKGNIFLSEDLSNESQESESVKYSCHDINSTEAATDVFYDSKENMWTEQNTSTEFLQTLHHTVTKTESPNLLIYGIGQMRQKDMLCECSSCSKGEYAITPDNDKADVLVEIVNQLKQKCLQFDLECESDFNDNSTVEFKNTSESPHEPSADTPQNSANDATHSDDCPAERLEWSSDQEDLIAEDMFVDDDGSKCGNFLKKECSDDSNHIGDNFNRISEAHNPNDAGSSNELSQKGRFHGQSKSDDELVTSGRYGQQVTNEAIGFMIVFSNSATARISAMDTNERMLRENVGTAPVVQVTLIRTRVGADKCLSYTPRLIF